MNKEDLIKDLNNQKDNLDKLFNDFKSNYETKIKEIDETIERLNKQEENNYYSLKDGEGYFYLVGNGLVNYSKFNHAIGYDNNCIEFNNWSRSEKEMKLRRKYIKIYNKLQNFMRENNIKIDWNNGDKRKYFIYYDFDEKCICISYNSLLVQSSFNFFTNTREQCDKAIELYGEEIKEYFELIRNVDYGKFNNYDKEYTGN